MRYIVVRSPATQQGLFSFKEARKKFKIRSNTKVGIVQKLKELGITAEAFDTDVMKHGSNHV